MARELALKVLVEVFQNGAYSNIALNDCLNKEDLKSCDKAFITEIVYGVLEYKERIDYIISQFSSVKLKKISYWILNILRMGIYQIIFMDKVPNSAAVNESVKLAKKHGHAYSVKFVNGVLRNIAKNVDNIKYPSKEKTPVEYLSIWYSYPKWFVQKCVNDFGYEFTEGFLDSSNKKPTFCIRVNTLKTTSDELMELLKDEGIKTSKSKIIDVGLIVENPQNITQSKLYKDGYFTIQDESSMLVAKVLSPNENDLVIDVCAAPGGKSTHIAEIMKNTGLVYSRDVHQHKVLILDNMAKRLGLKNMKPQVFDATKIDEKMLGKADRVLVDAPCTGLGIIRRKPDIKWTKEVIDTSSISKLQYNILENASKYLKVGGYMVYSTCTIEKEENIEVVNKFIKNHDNFVMESIEEYIPEGLAKRELAKKGYMEFYPNVHNTDGFFISKMKKIK